MNRKKKLFDLHTVIFKAQICIFWHFGVYYKFFVKQTETFGWRHALQIAAALLAAPLVVVQKVVMFSFLLSSLLPVAAGYSLC